MLGLADSVNSDTVIAPARHKTTSQAFDGTFSSAITSGNPVLFKPKTNSTTNNKLNLLIVGGSLG
jgi:hypothetical protein